MTSTPRVRCTSGCPGVRARPLTEPLQVVEGEAVPGEVEHRVQEDRGVTAREHEPVAVGPVGVARVVTHHLAEEHVGERSEGHGGARVPATRSLRTRPWRSHG